MRGMARAWRIEFEGAYYHVLSRGNEGRDIFYGDGDKELFLKTVGRMSERFQVDVFVFVLMSNHYHLLLRTNLANLSRAMQWLGVTYTRRFNNRHGRSGHLFQGRFKSIVVENEAYAIELSCYIHRNPVRAGMAKRLMNYKWSSYQAYAYRRKAPEWLNTDLILSSFSGPDPRKAYREKVKRYAKEERSLLEDLRHGLLLGSAGFVDKIKSRYVSEKPHREVSQQRGMVGRMDVEDYLRKASALLGRDLNRFREAGRLYGEEKEDRDILVYLLWQRGTFTNEEIGRFFGVGYSAVSHIVRRTKGRVRAEARYQKKRDNINSQIKM
jgi:putative transposase